MAIILPLAGSFNKLLTNRTARFQLVSRYTGTRRSRSDRRRIGKENRQNRRSGRKASREEGRGAERILTPLRRGSGSIANYLGRHQSGHRRPRRRPPEVHHDRRVLPETSRAVLRRRHRGGQHGGHRRRHGAGRQDPLHLQLCLLRGGPLRADPPGRGLQPRQRQDRRHPCRHRHRRGRLQPDGHRRHGPHAHPAQHGRGPTRGRHRDPRRRGVHRQPRRPRVPQAHPPEGGRYQRRGL